MDEGRVAVRLHESVADELGERLRVVDGTAGLA